MTNMNYKNSISKFGQIGRTVFEDESIRLNIPPEEE